MNSDAMRLQPYVEAARRFRGWELERHGVATLLGPAEPWDYEHRARELLASAGCALDIGTGGGERLESLLAVDRRRAVATESWPPNAPVAAGRLRRHGVDVVHAADRQLPFANASFDLVLNRHAGFAAGDIARVLRPDGRFLTQQISSDHWRELADFFPRATSGRGDGFVAAIEAFQSAGFTIVEARRHAVPAAFASLGDLVFMLCITPWTIPAFDPLGGDLDALLALERTCATRDGVVLTQGHYVIEAARP